jgi:DNA mismatch endonuclease (patch repair protein)
MVDRLSPEKRSWNMSRIRSGNTEPERKVRSILHRLGYRFRLHRRDLPGSPDIVLPKHRLAIFVHGCFWHRHGCSYTYTPKSRQDFWLKKFSGNTRRDRISQKALQNLAWNVAVIWECETQNGVSLAKTLQYLIRKADSTFERKPNKGKGKKERVNA